MDEPVVLVWLAVAVAGALVAVFNIRDGFGDVRAMYGEANGRRTLATEYVHQQSAYLVMQGLAIYLGLRALFDDRITPWTETVSILVAFNGLLLLMALLNRRTRGRVLRRVREDLVVGAMLRKEDES